MRKPRFHQTPAPPASANWEDLRAVREVFAQGTLSAAGAALGVNYTTVARRVARAEQALGVRLFERLADGYAPTEDAGIVAEHVTQMSDADHSLMRRLAGRDGRLSGRLTVTAPQLLIAHVLAPALQRVKDQHPDLDLRVRATNDMLDLTRREADIAFRISPDPGDTLKGLRLIEQHSASFASREWAERIKTHPDQPIDWIIYEGHDDLPADVRANSPSSRVRFRFDDMVAIGGAAQAGLGVARMPMFLGRSLPGLVQVPLLSPKPYAPIWLLSHADIWHAARVTLFRDVVTDWLKARRHQFVA